MTRFRFCKEGSAVYLSHLDMMRMFQRAFRRAGIEIAMTKGYNPHDFVSIALPLPVGMQSQCEILDCRLAPGAPEPAEAARMLNHAGFPDGIRVLEGYSSDRKIRELQRLSACIRLEYDRGVPDGAAGRIAQLLQGDTLVVEKRTKRGPEDRDIRPLLQRSAVREGEEPGVLFIDCTVCVGEPSLNPELLVQAIQRFLPPDAPDFSVVRRLEVYDAAGEIFR